MTPPVVDATIEVSHDGGKTWGKSRALLTDHGPWSVPHAIDIARSLWSSIARKLAPFNETPTIQIRVVDAAGVVVEQWPKTSS